MIQRYVYGTVIETDAVLNKPKAETEAPSFFSVDGQAMTFTYHMGAQDRVYGLGQNVRGINQRGWIYESKCSDDPNHTEDKRSLYGAHNFLVLDGQERFGVFIDYPGVLTVDIGYSRYSELKITASDWNLDCYIITGTDVKDIVKQFRRLIGELYRPSLGLWLWAEPVGVPERGRHPHGGEQAPGIGNPIGQRLPGY